MTRERRRSERLQAGALPDPSSVQGLLEQAADITVLVQANGEVGGIFVNPECRSIGSLDHWVGRPFETFLNRESRVKFDERVAAMRADADLKPRPLEINHVDNVSWEFPVRYSLHRIYENDDLLLLGRDMQPIAEVQQRLVSEQMARERDQQRLRSEQTFYNVVLNASETPFVIVEPERGRVRDVNAAAARLLGTKQESLVGSSLAQAFEGRKREELLDALRTSAGSNEAQGIELASRRNGHDLAIYPSYFRAAGELYLLCTLVSVGEAAAGSVEAAHAMSLLYSATSDAIVLTDGKGAIRDTNDAFLVLSDAAQQRDVIDTNLAEFFVRGAVDLKLMIEAASKNGALRNYATQMSSLVGTRASVDVAVTRLRDQSGEHGFGFIIRTVPASEGVDAETASAAVSEDAMKNVMDLVGTASLKELVSATSDVVEKLCIETAVQLTGNNRVAAAEMLGLSRQSLYVKLRKHGLINSNGED